MSLTVSNRSGDGVNDTFIESYIQLADTGGGSVVFGGSVQAPGGTAQVLSGSPLVMPAVPGSGTTYWNLQADVTSGVVTLQQSSVADPAPINGNNVVIFRQALASTAGSDVAYDGSSTPDQPV